MCSLISVAEITVAATVGEASTMVVPVARVRADRALKTRRAGRGDLVIVRGVGLVVSPVVWQAISPTVETVVVE